MKTPAGIEPTYAQVLLAPATSPVGLGVCLQEVTAFLKVITLLDRTQVGSYLRKNAIQ